MAMNQLSKLRQYRPFNKDVFVKKRDKAIIYTRFSPRPNADESTSTQTQLESCRKYCAEHGYEVMGEFSDEGQSGNSVDREGLWNAISSLRKGWVLVVRWRSRLAREVFLMQIIERAVAANDAFIEAADPGENNGDSPQDRLVRGILTQFAEYEREVIAARTAIGVRRNMASGRMVNGNPPYGYKRNPRNPEMMVENPYEQRILRIIMDMREHGDSYNFIAEDLTFNGFTNRSGGPWDRKQIQRIIQRHENNPITIPSKKRR